MELFEAVLISLISTATIIVTYALTKYGRRVRVYGPFAYGLNESGNLTEIPLESIPSKVVSALREKVLNLFSRPEKFMLGKSAFAIFALAVFFIQLIIFLVLIFK